MKRLTSLILALSIFLCYGGLYTEAFAAIGVNLAKTNGGCHGMTMHQGNASVLADDHGIISDRGGKEGSCCQESLTNAHPDLNSKIDVITIDRSQLHLANESQINRNKILDGSPSEHDPPDLQISFSTFLL